MYLRWNNDYRTNRWNRHKALSNFGTKSTGEQPTRMVRSGVLGRQQRIAGRQRSVVRVVSVRGRVDQLMGGLPRREKASRGPRTGSVQEPGLRPRGGHTGRQNERSPQGRLST